MANKDLNNEDPLTAELDAEREAEAVDFTNPDEGDNDEGDQVMIGQGIDANPEEPAELVAVHTDNESAHEASGESVDESESAPTKASKKVAKASVTTAKPKKRSQKYLEVHAKVDPKRSYSVRDAVDLVKETSYSKFDGMVEAHLQLVVKKSKVDSGERFRIVVNLPHGTGKEPRILILDEATIEQIKQKGDVDADILLATPALMPKVATIAKILGPKGKMPNPKTGTVTEDPEAAKRAIVSGRVELRADANHIIHQALGRVSWTAEKILENYQALVAAVPTHRLQKLSLTATMGPGILVNHKA